jgi:hypothetical protein
LEARAERPGLPPRGEPRRLIALGRSPAVLPIWLVVKVMAAPG